MRRTLLTACASAGVVVLTTTGRVGATGADGPGAVVQRDADLYQIDQIERTFHRAGSTHNVDLMMSLFAPGATFNVGTQAYTGRAQIRRFFATVNPAFQPGNRWVSDTPSYKIKETVNGNTATLYFQCHYVDPETKRVMLVIGVNHNLEKIDGRWLIVDAAASATTLTP
ncbi:MAG TPA: nuclear transport factor 2 family protein [Gaiellaceae bacterium]|nr:nuclear transport factor 2 family protein [Gaiellaceae bacterium]